jgi:hypothetical protein
MILIRYFLICLIGYLLVRAMVNYGHEDPQVNGKQDIGKKDNEPSKKVSKQIGEYVDYEEVKKGKS